MFVIVYLHGGPRVFHFKVHIVRVKPSKSREDPARKRQPFYNRGLSRESVNFVALLGSTYRTWILVPVFGLPIETYRSFIHSLHRCERKVEISSRLPSELTGRPTIEFDT